MVFIIGILLIILGISFKAFPFPVVTASKPLFKYFFLTGISVCILTAISFLKPFALIPCFILAILIHRQIDYIEFGTSE